MRNPMNLLRTVRELSVRAERQHKRIARLEREVGALLPQVTELQQRLAVLEAGDAAP